MMPRHVLGLFLSNLTFRLILRLGYALPEHF